MTMSSESSAATTSVHIPDDDPYLVGYFGLDAELRRSRLAKFNESDKLVRCLQFLSRRLPGELCARHLQRLLEQSRGVAVADVGSARLGVLHAALKDGVLLCELSNALFAGSIAKFNGRPKNVLQERENVDRFLASLDLHRVRPEERFTQADLHSGRDLVAVVDCLLALERVIEQGRGAYDPTRASLNAPLAEEVDAGPAVNQASSQLSERGYYGLGAEVQAKLESKFDEKRTEAALTWLRRITGKDVRAMEQLRDGVVLCTAVNALHPGAVRRFHSNSKIKMMWRENVQLYLQACSRAGIAQSDLFNVDDLIELKYPVGVVDNIFALGRYAPSSYAGARLLSRKGESRILSRSGRDVSRTERAPSAPALDDIVAAVDLALDTADLSPRDSSPSSSKTSQSSPATSRSSPKTSQSSPMTSPKTSQSSPMTSPKTSRSSPKTSQSSPMTSPATSPTTRSSPRSTASPVPARWPVRSSSETSLATAAAAAPSKRNSMIASHRDSAMFEPPSPSDDLAIDIHPHAREAGCFASCSLL